MNLLDRLLGRVKSEPPYDDEWEPPTGGMVRHDYLAERQAMALSCGANPWRVSLMADDLSTQRWDLNGVGWENAPLPPENHRCYVHTRAFINYFTLIERCACGGVCFDHTQFDPDHVWLERNTRELVKVAP